MDSDSFATNALASPYPYTPEGEWLMHHDVEQWMFAMIAAACGLFALNQLYITLGHLKVVLCEVASYVWARLPSFWNLVFMLVTMFVVLACMWAYVTGQNVGAFILRVVSSSSPHILPSIPYQPSPPLSPSASSTAGSWFSPFVKSFFAAIPTSSPSSSRDL